MIILGVLLLIIGFVTEVAIVWSIGMIVLVVGLVLWLLKGHGPRRRRPAALLLACDPGVSRHAAQVGRLVT
jgi:hypothetical protein